MKLRRKPVLLKSTRKPKKANEFGELNIENPFFKKPIKELKKRMEKEVEKLDSDYDEENEESESDEFDPIPKNLPNRPMKKDRGEKTVFNGLKIVPVKTQKQNIPQRPIMEVGMVPKMGSITIINGAISSGKTNLLYNMLANPIYYGKQNGKPYWDEIYLFTNSNDEMQDQFVNDGIIPENHIKRMPEPEDLDKLVKAQKKLIKDAKGDLSRVPIIFVIFDDIIDNPDFIKSKPFSTLFFRNRHLLCMTFILSQYFYAIPKKLRMQATNIIVFSGNEKEKELINDTYCPHTLNTKQFDKVVSYAWEPDKLCGEYPFFHICRKEKPDKRFRKTFEYVIDISKFKN